MQMTERARAKRDVVCVDTEERFNVSNFNIKKSGRGNQKGKEGNFKMLFEENEITGSNYIIPVK